MSKGKFDIYTVLNHLKEKRRYFSSEVDFQLALALQIEREYGDNSVICEYVPEYDSEVEGKKSRIHIDILFCSENIPIELKYRTKKADLYEANYYKISLTNHGARDEGSYGFWRDVCRVDEYKQNVKAPKGYVIFLTNEGWYKDPDYSKCKVDYTKFNLNDEYKNERSGIVSKKCLNLINIPKIKADWYEWDKEKGFNYFVAEV